MRFSNISILIFICLSIFSCISLEDNNRLTIWEMESDQMQRYLDKYIKQFEESNPGIKISRAHYSPEDLRNQFQSAGLADAGPDVAIAPNDFVGVWGNSGILLDPEGYYDLNPFREDALEFVKLDNVIWGVPWNLGNHIMLLYNKSLVPNPPTDTDELISICKDIKSANPNIYPFVYNLTDTYTFIIWFTGFGGWPISENQVTLNNSSMVNALQFVKDLKYKHQILPDACDYKTADTMFTEGKAAMLLNGDWALKTYAEELKNNLGIALLPMIKQTNMSPAPFVSGKYFFFNLNLIKKPKKKELIKKFVDFLLSDNIQLEIAEVFKRLPAKKILYTNPKITEDKIIMASYNQFSKGKAMPAVIEMRVCWDAIGIQLANIMDSKVDAIKAAELMQEAADIKLLELRR